MQPLGTKVYLLKRYSPSDSFCFSESVPKLVSEENYAIMKTILVFHRNPHMHIYQDQTGS